MTTTIKIEDGGKFYEVDFVAPGKWEVYRIRSNGSRGMLLMSNRSDALRIMVAAYQKRELA